MVEYDKHVDKIKSSVLDNLRLMDMCDMYKDNDSYLFLNIYSKAVITDISKINQTTGEKMKFVFDKLGEEQLSRLTLFEKEYDIKLRMDINRMDEDNIERRRNHEACEGDLLTKLKVGVIKAFTNIIVEDEIF